MDLSFSSPMAESSMEEDQKMYQSKPESWKEVIKFMGSNMSGFEEFSEAVRIGSVDILEQLVAKHGLDLTSKLAQSYNEEGETPLLVAIKCKHFKVVKFLIEILNVNFGQIGRFFWKTVDYSEVVPLFAALISDQRSIFKYLIDEEMKYEPSISFDSIMLSSIPRPKKIDQLELIGAAFILLRGSSTYYVEYVDRDGEGLARMCWDEAMILRYYPAEGEPEIPKIPFQLSSLGREVLRDPIEPTLEQVQESTASLNAQAILVGIRILSRAGLFPNLFIAENFYWLFMFEETVTPHHDEYLISTRVFRKAKFLMEMLEFYKWEDDIQDLSRVTILTYDSYFNYNCDDSILALDMVSWVIADMGAHLPSENWECWRYMYTFPAEFADFDSCMYIFNFCCTHISRVFAKFRHDDQPSSLQLIKDEAEQVTNLLVGIAGFVDVILMPRLTAEQVQQFKRSISQYIRICDELGSSSRSNFFHRFCCLNPPNYPPYYRENASDVIQFFIDSGMLDPNAVNDEGNTILHKLIGRQHIQDWINIGTYSAGEIKPRFLALVQMLDNGGQIDIANNDGKTVRDFLRRRQLELDNKQCFNHPSLDAVVNRPAILPLSSCCAQLIRRQKIPYENLEFPSNLKLFIRRGF